MDWLDEAELYLRLQLENGPRLRKHRGLNLLRLHKEVAYIHLRDYIVLAFNDICVVSTTEDGQTSCKLTNTSYNIGRTIMSTWSVGYHKNWTDFLVLGDLFIEAFYNIGLVDITIQPPRSPHPNEVIITDKWPKEVPAELAKMSLRGVWAECPPDISGPSQRVFFNQQLPKERKIVKKWDEEQDGQLRPYLKQPAFKALNKLQKTSWMINKEILEVVSVIPEAFKYKDGEYNLSKEIDYNYTVSKAKALVGSEFFFAMDMDYRGRLYYLESFLNFQGNDLAKGLLQFSEYKEVTPEGLRWLKIHAASSYNQSYNIDEIPQWVTEDYASHLRSEGLETISVDKMTLSDRESWCDMNKELIEVIANERIIDDEAEKPVCFLAAAIELRNYWNCDTTYYSALPIPIDGSNNGWQHLGAISKDERTGELVGLVPVGIQNDFYVQTAKRLIEITKHKERKDILKKMPMKAIRKAISKRGSMTRAYSAGAAKIAENMYNDCKKEGYHKTYGITEAHCKGFARDLVKAIEDVCSGPLKTMKWLQKIAEARLQENAMYINWTTPSGFPVIYENNHRKDIKSRGKILGVPNMEGKVSHVINIETDKPDYKGYACGISPNFVHSQDAAHMQIVIDRFDGAFGAVHDSFSTHACDVDKMLTITKDVFIEMYNHDNYFKDIEDRFGVSMDERPDLGSLNLEGIELSDYFFA